VQSLTDALTLVLDQFDAKKAEEVRKMESRVDQLEDALGSYLIKISSHSMDERDSEQITKLLHIIGDFERISDYAVNVVESAEELRDKKTEFSRDARFELDVLRNAICDILAMTEVAFAQNDLQKASYVEPLEQTIDKLMARIKRHHVLRLQRGECTIELGFVLNDLLVGLERVSDHCSNIAGCILEISQFGALDMHQYLDTVRHGSEEYELLYAGFKAKYSLDRKH